MSLVKIHKRKNPNKISKTEFAITKDILDYFMIEIDEEYNMELNYSNLYCGDKELAYSEHYSSLFDIPRNKMIFRPIKNERHSNILIEMFEELENTIERLEIEEYLNKNGNKRYSGYFISKEYGEDVIYKDIKVKGMQTIPALKTAIIAKFIFDDSTYRKFIEKLRECIFHTDGGR